MLFLLRLIIWFTIEDDCILGVLICKFGSQFYTSCFGWGLKTFMFIFFIFGLVKSSSSEESLYKSCCVWMPISLFYIYFYEFIFYLTVLPLYFENIGLVISLSKYIISPVPFFYTKSKFLSVVIYL